MRDVAGRDFESRNSEAVKKICTLNVKRSRKKQDSPFVGVSLEFFLIVATQFAASQKIVGRFLAGLLRVTVSGTD
jgi:hypothetical protein